MTKVYFIFLFCALTSAGAKDAHWLSPSGYKSGDASGSVAYGASGSNAGSYGSQSNLKQASSLKTASSDYTGSGSPSGYSDPGASSSYSGTSSYTGSGSANGHDSAVDYSSTASKTGYTSSTSNSALSKQQVYSGTTQQQEYVSNEKDHNGLSENDVNQLAVEASRRRMQRPFYMTPNRARLMAPKRYNSLTPSKYYSRQPVYGRSGDEADSNSAANYGSSGSNVGSTYGVEQLQRQYSSNNAGSGLGDGSNGNNANREGHQGYSLKSYQEAQSSANDLGASGANSDSSDSNQNAQEKVENSRRFYLGNNPYNAFSPNSDPYDSFAGFKAALGQYGM